MHAGHSAQQDQETSSRGKMSINPSCSSTSYTGNIPVGVINSYSPQAAAKLISVAGREAPFDEEVTKDQIPESYPLNNPPTTSSGPTDLTEPTSSISPEITSCGDFTEVDYSFSLSRNFTVRDLSLGAFFSHSIQAQHGFTDLEMICNLKSLCENCLEPLWSAFPGFRINSGFRTGTGGKSQHERGMAADVQWPGISNQEYLRRANFCRDNLLFDQFILEHGNNIWLHVSFNGASGSQRRQVLTMINNDYSGGLTLHYA